MPIHIIWDARGREQVRQLTPDAKQSVRRALRDIDQLWSQHAVPLRGFPDLYRLKVGNYRVILREQSGRSRFTIERAAHRDHIYDDYPVPDEPG